MEPQGGIVRGGEQTSHDNNGVKYVVKTTGQHVELEGDEIALCEAVMKSDKFHWYQDTPLNIFKKLADEYGCKRGSLDTIHGGEFIICKAVVRDDTPICVAGTPSEIVSYLQVEKGCKAHYSYDLNKHEEGTCGVCQMEAEKKEAGGSFKTLTPGEMLAGDVIFYRVDTGYAHPKDATAKDVIDFEDNEHGNTDEMNRVRKIAEKNGVDLSNIPATEVVWVTQYKTHAKRYGSEVGEVYIKNPLILDDDGDNGYLVLKNSDRYIKKGTGDCFIITARAMMDYYYGTGKVKYVGEPFLVHAEVVGGITPHAHAWIEDDVLVYDFANGHSLVLPKELYYQYGKVNPKNPKKYRRYSEEETMDKMLEHNTYGGWDLYCKLADGGEIVEVTFPSVRIKFEEGGVVTYDHENYTDIKEGDTFTVHNLTGEMRATGLFKEGVEYVATKVVTDAVNTEIYVGDNWVDAKFAKKVLSVERKKPAVEKTRFVNTTNSAYDRTAQQVILKYWELRKGKRAIDRFIRFLKTVNMNYADSDVYVYITKHDDIVYSISVAGIYGVALANDDDSANYLRLRVKNGVQDIVAAPMQSIFDWSLPHSEFYDDNGYLKQSVKDSAMHAIAENLALPEDDRFMAGGIVHGLDTDYDSKIISFYEPDTMMPPDATFEEGALYRTDYPMFKDGGQVAQKPATPKELEERWDKKKEHIMQLASTLRRLRYNLTADIKSDDEKERLTALVIAVMDKTGERVGNNTSALEGHKGVTGFCKGDISISGNTVTLEYVGKAGVSQDKSFTDEVIAKALKDAIANTPTKYIFTTSDGFKINRDRVDRYLEDFGGISPKDLRGYFANQCVKKSLEGKAISNDEKEREKQFKEALKYAAEKVGHGVATLKTHYLIPELEKNFILHGKLIDLTSFYKTGGLVKMARGGYVEIEAMSGMPARNWERSAGGVLLVAYDTGRCLFLKRGLLVPEPGKWGTMSGGINPGETPEQAIVREMWEELKCKEPVCLKLSYIHDSKTEDFGFYNFIGVVLNEFEPELNYENADYKWVNYRDIPTPLHFGVADWLKNVNLKRELLYALELCLSTMPTSRG